jgi:hypothetical protein
VTHRDVPAREFCAAMAEAGIFPAAMLDQVTDVSVALNPAGLGLITITLAMDDRIYDVVNPRRKRELAP